MKAKVRIRETNELKVVNITSADKPSITSKIVSKWQTLINNVAEIFEVPAGLIMRITETDMEVFLRSQNEENPYPDNGKDHLGHGLYCETVIGENRELLIDNSLKYDAWKDNPDVSLQMISYLGLPILWSDGEAFGTICALDNKTNEYDVKYRQFLRLMRDLIQADLELLASQQELERLSNTDQLTNIHNRRYAFNVLDQLSDEYRRYKRPYSIMMIDIDGFKKVNDQFGHEVGDEALKRFTELVKKSIRSVDTFARIGGDEFVIICKETPLQDMGVIGQKIESEIENDSYFGDKNVSISYGNASVLEASAETLLKEADQKMYHMKRQK